MLSDDGMLCAIFVVQKNRQIIQPTIVSRGFIYMKNSETLVSNIGKKASELLDHYLCTHKIPNYQNVKGYITTELSSYIYELTEKKPMIIPIIMELNKK